MIESWDYLKLNFLHQMGDFSSHTSCNVIVHKGCVNGLTIFWAYNEQNSIFFQNSKMWVVIENGCLQTIWMSHKSFIGKNQCGVDIRFEGGYLTNKKFGIYIHILYNITKLKISKPHTQTSFSQIKIIGTYHCPLFITMIKMKRKSELIIWQKLGFVPLI